ncbi:MAG: hypothetical protein IAE77_04780 [Prosthecobacter sp.]|jgi:hypothetical protein|uniref:hypothetical protein n=1 Tax=Prosthecobacter sp. TaxID=1965333 RepID=UPI001A05EE10|nr:hypothetical protein [Prosthecobacter sp.]MBE2282759.1 hypothetical protein [Prosthecobacter sp.]
MALFSGNRKVRSRRPQNALDLRSEPSPRGKTRHLAKRSDELNSQIHRLECFIADAPRLQRQQRLSNVNMVPPMDLPSPVRRNRRLPIAQQRARRGERLRMLTEGIFVVGAIAAVVGWLNQWLHFWN